MSMTDPIADMLTRIRNGQSAGKINDITGQNSSIGWNMRVSFV